MQAVWRYVRVKPYDGCYLVTSLSGITARRHVEKRDINFSLPRAVHGKVICLHRIRFRRTQCSQLDRLVPEEVFYGSKTISVS
jgi:hypothetical protein